MYHGMQRLYPRMFDYYGKSEVCEWFMPGNGPLSSPSALFCEADLAFPAVF